MKFVIKKDSFNIHQRKFWELDNYIKLLVAGYGSGKTYIAALRAIYLSYVNSSYPGMLVSPSFKMAKKTLIPTLREIMNRSGITYHYNKTDFEFTIKNWNGHFWIGSGDDPDSLRGPNLAWAGIDEPFIQKKEVFDQMIARIRIKDAKARELFLTGTPEELNWGHDVAVNDEKKYDIGFIAGKTKDNMDNLSSDYYDNLYNAYTPEQREAYLDGKFVNLTVGRAYKPFDRTRHIKHLDYKNLPVCAGIDFNVDYMTAVIFAHSNGWVHFFDEIRLTNSNSFELSERLKQKYPGINIYPDATGSARKSSSTKSDHQIFRDAGFRLFARRDNPRVMDRINAVNRLLLNDRMTIEPNTCSCLVKDLERNVFKHGELDKQSDLSLTHAGDAAGYPVNMLYPIRRVIVKQL